MPELVVSRETEARVTEVFGAGSAVIRYAELLVTTAIDRGLLGPREADRIWDRHIFNCAAVADAIPESALVVDIGSGAGLPGIVLALARPDLRLLLVEPLQRRADFLMEAVAELGLPSSVETRRARAEEVVGDVQERGGADVVTARAVAPLGRLAALALPLLRPGGSLLALKGRRAAEELGEAENSLRVLGASRWVVESWGGTMHLEPTTVVRIVAGAVDRQSKNARRRVRPTREDHAT